MIQEHRNEYGEHLVERVVRGEMTRRQLLVRASVMGLSATAAARLLAACGGSAGETAAAGSAAASGIATPEPVMGGTLKVAVTPSLTDLDPVTIYDWGGIALIQQFCEYLIDLDDRNAPVPKLAVSWSANEDASVWTFILRDGVKFSDGSPFEAADVVATMDRLVDPKSGSAALAALYGILSTGGTQAVDAATVRFELDRPFADFPYLVSAASYNTVMLPRTYAGDWAKKPVGTGPWLLKEYVAKQRCVAAKKADYWGKDAQGRQLPYMDEVDWVMIQDEAVSTLQLQSGAVDAQSATPFQGSQPLFNDPQIRVDVYPNSAIRELAFNVTKDPWQSKEVRQAVAYCLDREAINQALFDDRSQLGYDTFWQPTVFPGSPAAPERSQDYEKAKQLLATAGYADGLDVTLTFAKYVENPQYAQLIKAQCEPAGIRVKLEQLSYELFYAGKPDNTPWLNAAMVIVEWLPRPTPGVYAQAMLLPTSPWSSSHWNNEEFAAAFDKYMSTSDEASRETYATQLSQIQQEETPIGISFFVSQPRAQRSNVYGIRGAQSINVAEAFKTA
jgi:peptide/nickel transport system substrate-binding protein